MTKHIAAAFAACLALTASEGQALTTIDFTLPFFSDVYPTVDDPFETQPGSAMGSVTFDENGTVLESGNSLFLLSVTAFSVELFSGSNGGGDSLGTLSVGEGFAFVVDNLVLATREVDFFEFQVDPAVGTATGAFVGAPFNRLTLQATLPADTIDGPSVSILTQENFDLAAASAPFSTGGGLTVPGRNLTLLDLGGPGQPSNATIFGAEPAVAVIPLPAGLPLLGLGLAALAVAGRRHGIRPRAV
ncbi:MAG: hypothetical protein AAFN17_06650 [Pseudomonadota bacterium]